MGHLKARAYRTRSGPRIVLVWRTCYRWFTDTPIRSREPILPDFVTADRLAEKL